MTVPNEKSTMKTIAEEAGVTLITVSRVLSNKDGICRENPVIGNVWV